MFADTTIHTIAFLPLVEKIKKKYSPIKGPVAKNKELYSQTLFV